jgi:hypothetical protein
MSEELNSNQYKEMSDHFKTLYDELTEKLNQIKKENCELKKIIMCSYGFSRALDDIVDDEEVPSEISVLLSLLRGRLSITLDNYIFRESDLPNED